MLFIQGSLNFLVYTQQSKKKKKKVFKNDFTINNSEFNTESKNTTFFINHQPRFQGVLPSHRAGDIKKARSPGNEVDHLHLFLCRKRQQ